MINEQISLFVCVLPAVEVPDLKYEE